MHLVQPFHQLQSAASKSKCFWRS